MNVQIQSLKFDADSKLIEFIETKMAKLDRFAECTLGADVTMKLDKDHIKGNKVVAIALHMPGGDLLAESRAKSFEEAADEAIDALKKQLSKVKCRAEK